jgi:hypothetical protein
MERKMHCKNLFKAGLTLAHVAALLGSSLAVGGLTAAPAQAVVYCKTVGSTATPPINRASFKNIRSCAHV